MAPAWAPAAPRVLPVFAWADVPGCPCKASPGDGAQRDQPRLSARPRHPLKLRQPWATRLRCHHPAKPPLARGWG